MLALVWCVHVAALWPIRQLLRSSAATGEAQRVTRDSKAVMHAVYCVE